VAKVTTTRLKAKRSERLAPLAFERIVEKKWLRYARTLCPTEGPDFGESQDDPASFVEWIDDVTEAFILLLNRS
jgi:hypothetical protein